MKKASERKITIGALSLLAVVVGFAYVNSGNAISLPSLSAPPQSCVVSSADTGYLIIKQSDGSTVACNTKTGKIEMTDVDPSNSVNYAITHLDSARSAPQIVTVSGTFDNAKHAINVVSNLHLTFIGQYKVASNLADNAVIHTVDYSKKQGVIIDGNGIIDCGQQPSSAVISGIYVQQLDHYLVSGLNIQHCPHVGLYIKGGTFGTVDGVTAHDSISAGPAVGTNFGFFGGHDNTYKNLVSYGACGPLGNGYQIEANDESQSGPDYWRANTLTSSQAHDNCGSAFTSSNTGQGNVISNFKFWNSGKDNVRSDNGQGIVFTSGEVYDAGAGAYNFNMGSGYLMQIDHSKIYSTNGNAKGGIYFANNPGLPGLTVDSNSIQNLPVGVEIAGQNAKITNNCFNNVQQPILLQPSGTASQVNNEQC